jgi:hypothetical protein
MDLAAGNTATTREAFSYLNSVYAAEPTIFNRIDAWNSHSYPNPAFSAAPTTKGQNSLRGYEYELDWWAKHADKKKEQLKVYITETGWEDNARTRMRLVAYYQSAYDTIWATDERIVAVTPFVLRGSPGPFAKFSFLDENLEPTRHYLAYWQILKQYNPPRSIY